MNVSFNPRRVAEIDSGKAVLIPHEQVAAEIDELLKQPQRHH